MNEQPVVELRLADVGEGLADAEIVEWHVRPGDAVRADQTVVTVMTDKAAVDLPAPSAGRVIECVGAPGSVVRVGEVLVRIAAGAPASVSAAPQAAPSTRRRAADLGVDLRRVTGTGPGGRVLLEDVEVHAARASAAPGALRDGAAAVEPLRGLRRAAADAVALAWRTIPAMVEFRDVDASALVRARGGVRAQRAADAPPFTYLPFFICAVAAALRERPAFNATFDAGRGAAVRRATAHIGIAVATDEGLVVPVVRDADARTPHEIAADVHRLVEAARARRLRAEDLSGASVTITNYGSYGTTAGIPIVRAGESAIVGFGAVHDAVVAVDGAAAVRPALTLTVAADHRLNDGRELAAFTAAIAGALADPDRRLAPPHGQKPAST